MKHSKDAASTAYSLLKGGMTTAEVSTFLIKRHNINPSSILGHIYDAKKLLEIEVERDPEILRQKHIDTYKSILKKNKDLYKQWIFSPQDASDLMHNSAIIQGYRDSLKAIMRIEGLYNLHSTGAVEVIAKTYFDKAEDNSSVDVKAYKLLDYNLLSEEEMVELLGILEECVVKDEEEDQSAIKAPDGSKEVRTKPVNIDDPMYSKEIRKGGSENIVEYRIKQGTHTDLTALPKGKTLKEVNESLLMTMMQKAGVTYRKQDKDRDHKGENLFADDKIIKIKLDKDGNRIEPDQSED